MRNRFVIWVVGVVVAALMLTDILPAFAQSAVTVVAAPIAAEETAEPGRLLLAQNQKPRRRRTLMDLLFGDDEEAAPPPPVVEKRVVRKPRRAAPAAPSLPAVPEKPKVNKAEGATRLAVFGDSMAVDVGKALERFYAEDPNITIIGQGVGSSGIVRDDFFDWPEAIDQRIDEDSFDIAVMIIGINDRQNIAGNKPLTDGWTAAYKARVAGIVEALRIANKPTIWIGLPPMSQPSYGKAMIQINEVQRLAVFGAGAEFLDIYERFADEDGKYTSRGPDLNGAQVRMRKDDGIHFSAAGADKLAFYISQSLKTYYRGGGTVGIEIADPLLGTDAQLMLRPPYQGLGQMKLLEVAGAVISLTHTTHRAADLISSDMFSLTAEDEATGGFDITQMLEAPIGRADAFGVGIAPEAEEEDEAIDAAALATPAPVQVPPAQVVPVAESTAR
ncbi:DUF459 domain-containing protein [Devosia sp.]|uniref:SGNH/GDSL hydrolase family protein n=1 Tax=Devosia sp. TaxID=1871048 RepID=UPI003A901663